MESRQSHLYTKACWENHITIYPKPSNTGKYKIIINTKGREKEGTEVYHDKPYIKEVVLHTPTGIKREKVQMPSVWEKINELYKQICIKNKLVETINN
jgi:hypothetical protein